jgi:uncharacterized membrane protein
MLGFDQIIVALWFLPVVLFIIIPLTMTCIWVVVSPIIALFRPVAGQSKEQQSIKSAATA